jgi:hypothetical protein
MGSRVGSLAHINQNTRGHTINGILFHGKENIQENFFLINDEENVYLRERKC